VAEHGPAVRGDNIDFALSAMVCGFGWLVACVSIACISSSADLHLPIEADESQRSGLNQ
jgi:hypothetical protein